MRHHFATRPIYRFDESVINGVFRQQVVAGTFVLQASRDLHRGATSFIAAADVKTALLEELRNPSYGPALRRWRFWRYLAAADS